MDEQLHHHVFQNNSSFDQCGNIESGANCQLSHQISSYSTFNPYFRQVETLKSLDFQTKNRDDLIEIAPEIA